jgi:DNA-binding NtrC family response regulator
VRELDNRIQRGVALTTEGLIPPNALFGDGAGAPEGTTTSRFRRNLLAASIEKGEPIDIGKELERIERELFEAALKKTGDNLTEAGRLLGLSFRQVRYKVRQLGLR